MIEIVKLDGRRDYKVIDSQLCQLGESFTDSCSGCYESVEGYNLHYPIDKKAGCPVGMGCEECGYTGKRIHQYWEPVRFVRVN